MKGTSNGSKSLLIHMISTSHEPFVQVIESTIDKFRTLKFSCTPGHYYIMTSKGFGFEAI